MSPSYTIIIEGKPIPKMRPRFASHGRFFPFVYDAQKDIKLKIRDKIFDYVKEKYDDIDFPKIAATYKIELRFYFRPPESLSLKQRNALLWNLKPFDIKPDLDNIEKFYLDCASGILWNDDKQVVALSSEKYYEEFERTEMTLTPVLDMKLKTEDINLLLKFSPSEMFEFLNDIKVLYTDPKVIKSLERDDFEIWISKFSEDLTDFSDKYSKKLKEISKMRKNDKPTPST